MIYTDMPDTYCIIDKIYKPVILIYNASNSGPCKMTATEKRISFSCELWLISQNVVRQAETENN